MNQINWDHPTEDPIWEEEEDEAQKRQDEEDLAQSRVEDWERGWYN